MATEVVETIGSGGDYADISSWVAGLPADLTAQDEVRIGRLIDASDYSEASTIDISGITTDATRYAQLEAASGVRHTGTGDGSGARYAYTGGGHAFTVGIDHFRTRWIDYSYPSGGGSSDEVFRWTGTGEFWCEFVLGHDIPHSDGDFIYPNNQPASQTLYTSNCLFWTIGRAACHIQSEENLTWYLYNCTGWNCNIASGVGDADNFGTSGFSSSPNTGSVMVAKNTYAHDGGAGGSESSAFFDRASNGDFSGSTNNISSDTSAPGTNSQTNVSPTGEFQSLSGTIDLHIVDGGTLEEAGADLSADANLVVTTDIDGESRTDPYDVGGDEVSTSGASPDLGTTALNFAPQDLTASTAGGISVSLGTVALNLDTGASLGVNHQLSPVAFDLAPQVLQVTGGGLSAPLGTVSFDLSPQELSWVRTRALGVASFSLSPQVITVGAAEGDAPHLISVLRNVSRDPDSPSSYTPTGT